MLKSNGKKAQSKTMTERYDDVSSVCSVYGWDIKELFWRASRKHASSLRRAHVMRDVEQHLWADAGIIPEYVRKYVDRILAVRKRELRLEMVKKLSPPYRRPSPAQVRW